MMDAEILTVEGRSAAKDATVATVLAALARWDGELMAEIRLATPKEREARAGELLLENIELKRKLKQLSPSSREVRDRRDKFVMAALTGMVAYSGSLPVLTAERAIELADAVIAALDSSASKR